MSERVHVVGIGGIGTSALAVILAQAGAVVSGSEDSGTILAGELLDRFRRSVSGGGIRRGIWTALTV